MPSDSQGIGRAAKSLANIVSGIASAGLAIMTIVIAWQVFARYVLNDSPAWSESAALIIMLYFVLLAAAIGVLLLITAFPSISLSLPGLLA